MVDRDKRLEVARLIVTDAEVDARAIDGKNLDGRTTAEILGKILAQIWALGNIVESILVEMDGDTTPKSPPDDILWTDSHDA